MYPLFLYSSILKWIGTPCYFRSNSSVSPFQLTDRPSSDLVVDSKHLAIQWLRQISDSSFKEHSKGSEWVSEWVSEWMFPQCLHNTLSAPRLASQPAVSLCIAFILRRDSNTKLTLTKTDTRLWKFFRKMHFIYGKELRLFFPTLSWNPTYSEDFAYEETCVAEKKMVFLKKIYGNYVFWRFSLRTKFSKGERSACKKHMKKESAPIIYKELSAL